MSDITQCVLLSRIERAHQRRRRKAHAPRPRQRSRAPADGVEGAPQPPGVSSWERKTPIGRLVLPGSFTDAGGRISSQQVGNDSCHRGDDKSGLMGAKLAGFGGFCAHATLPDPEGQDAAGFSGLRRPDRRGGVAERRAASAARLL